jgi:hypothetical protein
VTVCKVCDEGVSLSKCPASCPGNFLALFLYCCLYAVFVPRGVRVRLVCIR